MVSNGEHTDRQRPQIPAGLASSDRHEYPSLKPGFVRQIRKEGWDGVGAALAIFDSEHRLMVAEHLVTSKNKTLAWGPNSETVQGSKLKVEHLLTTAGRCLFEELGITNPNDLGLRDYGPNRWTISPWTRPKSNLLAFTLPFFIPDAARDRLLAQPPNTDEISRVRFLPIDEVAKLPNLRDGTLEWIADPIAASGLDRPQAIGELVPFCAVEQDKLMRDTDHALFAGATAVFATQLA